MKRVLRVLLIVPVIFSFVITNMTAFAWSDSSNGRPSYSLQEIYERAEEFSDTPFFNSINIAESDYKWYEETFGESLTVDEVANEKNYVIARETGNTDTPWATNEITVEDGKTYTIRAYICNDNPHDKDATSEGTRFWFSIPRASGTEANVNGFISSRNAFPEEYVDYVTFRNEEAFHLEFIAGSATILSNGTVNGSTLSDEVIKTTSSEVDGVFIGYDSLDGNLPGGRRYACNIDIQVKAVFDHDFLVEQKARIVGNGKEWLEDSIGVKVGDIIEFQTQYKNLSAEPQYNVATRNILPPGGLRYVEGSTILYNTNFPDGTPIESDAIVGNGIGLGSYDSGANAYVRFRAEVVSIPEKSSMTNWIQIQAGADKLIMNDGILIYQSKNECSVIKIIAISFGITTLIVIAIIIVILQRSKRRDAEMS